MRTTYKIVVTLLIAGVISTGFGSSLGASSVDEGNVTQTTTQKSPNNTRSQLEQFFINCFDRTVSEQFQKKQDKLAKKGSYSKKQREQASKPDTEEQINKEEEVTEEQNTEQNEEQSWEQEENEQKENIENKEQDTEKDSALSQFEQEVVQLTNAERAKQGLQALQIDEELSAVAREKSRDMQQNNYFDHTSPVYGSPFDMMKAYGITYSAAGENIAKGQRTPEEVVNAWMNSPGHRANILNNSYTHIGVGYIEQGNYWTQQFIGK